MIRFLHIAALAMSIFSAAAQTPTYDRLRELDEKMFNAPVQERVASLVVEFDVATNDIRMQRGCEAVAPADVDDYFRSSIHVGKYTLERQWLDLSSCLYRRLESTSATGPIHHRRFHGLLVTMMEFERANDVRRRSGLDLQELPALRGIARSGRTVARVTGAGPVRRERLQAVEKGWQMIAIVHPGCAYSRQATEAMILNEAFAWMRPMLALVVPPGDRFPHATLQEWNAQHPDLPMLAMIPGPGWREMDVLGTPTFHLLKDGALVDMVHGWKDNGRDLEALRQHMETQIDERPARSEPQTWFHR